MSGRRSRASGPEHTDEDAGRPAGVEQTCDIPGEFGLKAINDQIRQLASGVEKLPPAAMIAVRRADLKATQERRRSFFTSYISGKTGQTKNRRFNFYVRAPASVWAWATPRSSAARLMANMGITISNGGGTKPIRSGKPRMSNG